VVYLLVSRDGDLSRNLKGSDEAGSGAVQGLCIGAHLTFSFLAVAVLTALPDMTAYGKLWYSASKYRPGQAGCNVKGLTATGDVHPDLRVNRRIAINSWI
jgi:hypothetical protein